MADDESIELPQQLAGDWRVVDHKFGSGGQGRAVLIERSDATRGVLKLARLDEAIDRARFAREVGILTSIDHSSIVKLLASSAEDGWYVTPAGLPLRRFWGTWCQGRHVNEIFDLALSFGRQLLDGLSLFHARGGVHRDIKPENVIVAVDPSPRPVLIDFGIAYEHDDDRLTETRGRLVASNFASPAEALYRRLEQPTAQWDCLQIAWLLAWLLKEGREPKFGRYHWRHHVMVDHPSTSAVRALLAATTDDELSPRDAPGMLRMMDTVGLGSRDKGPEMDTHLKAAAEARERASAERLRAKADQHERGLAAAALLGPVYEQIRREVAELVGRVTKESGLPVAMNVYNPGPSWLPPSMPVVESLSQRALGDQDYTPCMFSVTCGDDERNRFHVYLEMVLRMDMSPNPFVARLSLRHETGEFHPLDEHYIHVTQIDRADVDRGLVLLNVKNLFSLDELLPFGQRSEDEPYEVFETQEAALRWIAGFCRRLLTRLGEEGLDIANAFATSRRTAATPQVGHYFSGMLFYRREGQPTMFPFVLLYYLDFFLHEAVTADSLTNRFRELLNVSLQWGPREGVEALLAAPREALQHE